MKVIYQLEIELAGSHPEIWRRVTVPNDTPFDQLNHIIQICMGWENEYQFEFIVNKTTVRDFGPELDMGENPYDRDAMSTVLDELITMIISRFTYTYGHWKHQITLEKILYSDEGSEHPVCMNGHGACPPADLSDISHYEDGPENVMSFNIKEVNARLRRYAEEWEEIYDETGKIIDELDEHNSKEPDDTEEEEC